MEQTDDNRFIPMTSITGGSETTKKEDMHFLSDQIVDVIFIGKPQNKDWVLTDTGMRKSYKNIIEAAEKKEKNLERPHKTYNQFGLIQVLDAIH